MKAKRTSFLERSAAGGVRARTDVERLLLAEYGSVFVARCAAPPFIVFEDERQVDEFQRSVPTSEFTLGGLTFFLQEAAADALVAAADEASRLGRSITPRGPDSGNRSYSGTIELWASRVEPALDHWLGEGRIDEETAKSIRSASPFEQVPMVLELEQQGIFFAKDLSKSIIYSVAPPGASQHLALLAFDVAEFDDAEVRSILARHRWYQTVTSDLPHFTYLGIDEADLSSHGLRIVENAGRTFWVPEM